jgi:Protein of unknown function (DUF4038)/Domain of unknown function (DUF5060)/Putative collagen-binding domain of a collagenase
MASPPLTANLWSEGIVTNRFWPTTYFVRHRNLLVRCIGLCYLFVVPAAASQPVSLWGRWDFAMQASRVYSDMEVAAELVSPSGSVFTVFGFWDGGSTWRLRFMPNEVGLWRYRTRSVPAVEGLDGRSGEFPCLPASETTLFLKHGAIRIAANGRHFEHADGLPFFWMGDTAWYGALLSSRDDWRTYLADRSAKKFSVVHFNVVAPRNGVSADENGQVSFSGGPRFRLDTRLGRLQARVARVLGLPEFEPIRINPEFYRRLDERINEVNDRGLLAAIVLTWGLGPADSGNALPEAEVIGLIRYLMSRYGSHHVVWIMTGDNPYRGEGGERWKRIGRGAFGMQRVRAPVTTHPNGMIWPWDGFRNEGWLDFLVYQSGHGDDPDAVRWLHSGPASRHWRDSPARPIINLEPPYEGHLGYQSRRPHGDYATRRAIYWSLLTAPTAGVTYGAHGVWSWHTAVGKPPTDHPNTGVAKTWREALSFPGSTQMRHLAEFFASVPWWTLQPDEHLLVEQPGIHDPFGHVSASRAADGSLAVLYLPSGGTVRITHGLLQGSLRAAWMDPRSGRRQPIVSSSLNEFTAPDARDWILVLEGGNVKTQP